MIIKKGQSLILAHWKHCRGPDSSPLDTLASQNRQPSSYFLAISTSLDPRTGQLSISHHFETSCKYQKLTKAGIYGSIKLENATFQSLYVHCVLTTINKQSEKPEPDAFISSLDNEPEPKMYKECPLELFTKQ